MIEAYINGDVPESVLNDFLYDQGSLPLPKTGMDTQRRGGRQGRSEAGECEYSLSWAVSHRSSNDRYFSTSKGRFTSWSNRHDKTASNTHFYQCFSGANYK